MFGIGLSELLVICCVAVICIHPKDLPKAARGLGRLYARLGRYYRELASVPEQLMEEIRKEAQADEAAGSADDPGSDESIEANNRTGLN